MRTSSFGAALSHFFCHHAAVPQSTLSLTALQPAATIAQTHHSPTATVPLPLRRPQLPRACGTQGKGRSIISSCGAYLPPKPNPPRCYPESQVERGMLFVCCCPGQPVEMRLQNPHLRGRCSGMSNVQWRGPSPPLRPHWQGKNKKWMGSGVRFIGPRFCGLLVSAHFCRRTQLPFSFRLPPSPSHSTSRTRGTDDHRSASL